MDIMELGAIGELVGGVAVVVTLGYLAAQIRQNTKSTRYLATQSLVAGQAEANFLWAAHDDLAAIMHDGVMNAGAYERFDPHTQTRFSTCLIGMYCQVDFAYHQYVAGQLDESVWKRWDFEIPLFFLQPGMVAWWARDKSRFSPEFAQYVDRRLAAFEMPPMLPTMGTPRAPS